MAADPCAVRRLPVEAGRCVSKLRDRTPPADVVSLGGDCCGSLSVGVRSTSRPISRTSGSSADTLTRPSVNIPRCVGSSRCTWRACHVQRRYPTLRGMLPSEVGGGCGIRTREGLHPTRFPSERHRPLGESSARKVTGIGKRGRTGRQWCAGGSLSSRRERANHPSAALGMGDCCALAQMCRASDERLNVGWSRVSRLPLA